MSKFRATIQYPKTPKLRIFKSDDGSFLISYGDNDPLGVRSVETNSLDKEIVKQDKQIYNLKEQTNEKIIAVDSFGDDELERFFADRYRQYLDSIAKTDSSSSN